MNPGDKTHQDNTNIKAVIEIFEACLACHANVSGSSSRQAAQRAYSSPALTAQGSSRLNRALTCLAKTIGLQLASGPKAPKSEDERERFELISNQVRSAPHGCLLMHCRRCINRKRHILFCPDNSLGTSMREARMHVSLIMLPRSFSAVGILQACSCQSACKVLDGTCGLCRQFLRC